jgi:CubicO group peptidase (beta-lactamase class C family)
MQVSGQVAPGLEPVSAMFADVLAEQGGPGAGLAIWRPDAGWVVDLWGGWADAEQVRQWQPDTIAQPYSVSKPFVGCAALLLVDRGLLDLDAAVQRYWPQFRTRTSVRQLLSHQSGVVALRQPAPTETFYDWDEMCRLLAEQEPEWLPGDGHGESALFYGHLVGELVRRIDGRPVAQFVRDELTGPHGLDFQFGLSTDDQARAADLSGFAALRETLQAAKPPDSLYWRAISNPPGNLDPDVVNGPRWRAAAIPAINGHGTARAVAGLYAALQQGAVLSSPLLKEARTAQSVGIDKVFGEPNSWGLGFGVDGDGYGMGGLGGSYAGYSLGGDYAIGFVTAALGSHDRIDRLDNCFRVAIDLPPLD